VQLLLAIQSGARAGQTAILAKPYSTIGRHAASDLRFDPERDLSVSSRHAAVVLRDGIFTVRDLGSTNGTLVNGVRLSGEHVLADGDVIDFGEHGPRAAVTVQFGDLPVTIPTGSEPQVGTRSADGRVTITSGHDIPRPRVAAVRAALDARRRSARIRLAAGGLAAVLVGVVGLAVWQTVGERRIERRRSALLREVDSLGTALRAMSVSIQAMQLALDSADLETMRLRREIGQAGRNPRELALLRRRLSDAAQRQRVLTGVAGLDASAIAKANRAAVSLVVAEFTDGSRYSGTAFAVRSGPATTLVVTNRHIVTTAAGAAPSRLEVVFDGSAQSYRAEVVSLHPTADLALLRVFAAGRVPAVRDLATDPPPEGAPVATIGFPLGLDLAMDGDWRRVGVSATTGVATVSRLLPGLVQLDGYGAAGTSGSPVFDAAGDVTAVLYGGERESQGRIVYAAPARQVRELLVSAGAE
jgi:hypothetical protein